MKRVSLLALTGLTLLQSTSAQITLKTKAEDEHRISLVFTPQQYLNAINISGEGAPQVIHTQNTFGYKLGLDYQRTTRNGLIFSPLLVF